MLNATRNVARKYGAKVMTLAGGLGLAGAAMADPTDPSTAIFNAIGLTGVVGGIAAVALTSIGIAVGFKAWALGKKATNKV